MVASWFMGVGSGKFLPARSRARGPEAAGGFLRWLQAAARAEVRAGLATHPACRGLAGAVRTPGISGWQRLKVPAAQADTVAARRCPPAQGVRLTLIQTGRVGDRRSGGRV